MECRLARETKVLGENLPQRLFFPLQNRTWPDPGLNPGRRSGKPATNRLSYGAAFLNDVSRRWCRPRCWSSWGNVACFDAMVKRWDKCISVGGEYIEK
jgi:hypothetical protein